MLGALRGSPGQGVRRIVVWGTKYFSHDRYMPLRSARAFTVGSQSARGRSYCGHRCPVPALKRSSWSVPSFTHELPSTSLPPSCQVRQGFSPDMLDRYASGPLLVWLDWTRRASLHHTRGRSTRAALADLCVPSKTSCPELIRMSPGQVVNSTVRETSNVGFRQSVVTYATCPPMFIAAWSLAAARKSGLTGNSGC